MAVVFFVLIFIISLLSSVYLASKKKFNYWKKKNVPYVEPLPIFGNYKEYLLQKEILGIVAQKLCREFPKEPYIGTYFGTEPALLVQDPQLIKIITTKDFQYFNGREVSKYTESEIVTRNLFFTHGDRWKVIRQNMSPLFTAAKIKGMFPLVQKCVHDFEKLLIQEEGSIVSTRTLMSRYSMECICSLGFGIDANTMDNNVKENPFRKIGNLIFESSVPRGAALASRAIWPAIFYGLKLQVFPKDITDFFDKLLIGVFKSRNYEPSSRNDFVDMVLNLKKSEYITCESMLKKDGHKVTLKLDDEFLVSQCALFFAAGYETTSLTMSYTLFELAKDQENQKRAAEEVDSLLQRHGGKVTYECVSELPFLEACVDEAMRLYPALSTITREVMENYTLPDGLQLEKGIRIHLPVFHLHRHPDYFPDPEEFRPERFLPENKHLITPYTYMPFGEGLRICIGMRVGKMQVMAGMVTILKDYRVELPEGSPTELKFDPTSFTTSPLEEIKLKFIRRK